MELLPVILALFAVGFLAVAILDRALALAAFCALLPAYLLRFTVPIPGLGGFALPTTFLEVLFGILFVVWFLMDGRGSDVWQRARRWHMPFLLLLIGATIGIAVSPAPLAGAGLWRAYFVEPMLFFFLFLDVVRTPRHRNMIVAALGTTLVAAGLMAIYQKVTGDAIPNPYWAVAGTRRATSLYGFPNAIGLFGAPVVTLLAGRAISLFERRTLRDAALGALALAAAAVGALGILFAVSEGALIGLAAGLLVLALFFRSTRAAALILVIAGCMAILATRPLLQYASDIVGLRDTSGTVRTVVWRESAAMLAGHPIFGAGLSGYPLTMAPYHQALHIEIFQYPHSLLLNFWSETGLIGVAAFIWLLVLFFQDAWTLRTRENDWLHLALIAAMTAMLVHGLVDVPYFKNDLAFLVMIMLCLMAGMRIRAS